MKATDFLSRDEIKTFTRASDFRGLRALATTWLLVAGAFALAGWHPAAWTIGIALIILGGRHLALAILMHDCSHYSLFKTRWLNDFAGKWFCGSPTWLDLRRYREHHTRHHLLAGTEADPDRDLVVAYPTSRASLIRKFARDLTGASGIRRLYGLALMDLGFIKFTVSSTVTPIDQTGRTARDFVAIAVRNLHGVAITNGALFAILYAVGRPWLYLLWIVSYLTTFSLILRIRSIAEHACTHLDPDPRRNTRTTYASPLARITVAPHRVNYHLEHHLLMTVPYFRLPELHRLLRERGAYANAHVLENYGQVIRAAVHSQRT